MIRRFPQLSVAQGCVLAVLVIALAAGVVCYSAQRSYGLALTGLSRDAPWGLYISQFAFLVGIAASAVTVTLPYYLHQRHELAELLLVGELVSVVALVQAFCFVWVDLGQAGRVANVILFPSPRSLMFWDFAVLSGYLVLSLILLGSTLWSRRRGSVAPPGFRLLAMASIPWAFAIHTVTALLFAGLAARPAWMTALLAPRFLATAFASGPALLMLLVLALRRTRGFAPQPRALEFLAKFMAYALLASIFFAALEAFTSIYSGVPGALEHLEYTYAGLRGQGGLRPAVLLSSALSIAAIPLLLRPATRRNHAWLAAACAAVLISVFLDKGYSLVPSGFVPSPLGQVNDYVPTLIEIGISAGIYAAGGLLLMAAFCWLWPVTPSAQESNKPLGVPPSLPQLSEN